jgi:hypothetical protein
MNLHDCSLIRNATTHRSSSYDRTGGNLDFLADLAPETSAVLLDTAGPGKITHFWLTLSPSPTHATALRDLVLRIYWEGAPVPSVDVPLGDFFGLGHALPHEFYQRRKFQLNSAPIVVGQNERALNCYWPMPFQRAARVEIYNNGVQTQRILYFHVDYELGPQPENSGLFHAVFHQAMDRPGQMPDDSYVNLDGRDNYLLLETKGRGQYLGCFFYIDTNLKSWWGEGDDMIFIDHSPMPAIYGTGSEDYFNNAWGYGEPFSYAYYGAPLLTKHSEGEYNSLYRFHIPDPVHFKEHIKVTMECWWYQTQTVNVSSVAFWYQDKPIASRAPLPPGRANHPHFHPLAPEEPLRSAGWNVRLISLLHGHGLRTFGGGGVVVQAEGREIVIPIPAPADGRYRVELKPLYSLLEGPMTLRLDGEESVVVQPQQLAREKEDVFLLIGEADASGGIVPLRVSVEKVATIHAILLTKL